jgi:hypothetical protein
MRQPNVVGSACRVRGVHLHSSASLTIYALEQILNRDFWLSARDALNLRAQRTSPHARTCHVQKAGWNPSQYTMPGHVLMNRAL